MVRPEHKIINGVLKDKLAATIAAEQEGGWMLVDFDEGNEEYLRLIFVKNHHLGYEDSFGKQISDNTTNKADIAAHYDFSPERHRLYINGSAVLLQYGSNAKFEDAVDSLILKPAAGDVMELFTAERFRYVVGYVLSMSAAFGANQSLAAGDKIVIGFGDPDLTNDMADADGWFWEWRGGEADTTVHLTCYRMGTKIADEQVDDVEKGITIWQRWEDRINWYNVGNRVAFQTYTLTGDQYNPIIGKTSVDNGKGPSSGNKRVVFAVKADASTTGLELECGSIGIQILGNVTEILRVKDAINNFSHSGGGAWEPLFAARIDPARDNVNVQLSELIIMNLDTDVNFEIAVIAVDPSKTDASSFGAGNYEMGINSVVQVTDTITTFPDRSGTLQTSSALYGGFQIGFTSQFTGGSGNGRTVKSDQSSRKRPVYEGDIVIFMGKCTHSGVVTGNLLYEFDENW